MPVNDVALVRKRQTLLATLRQTTAAQLARRWTALDSYDNETAWLRTAGPVLLAGQSRAVDLQVAHLQALLGARITFDRPAILENAAVDLTEPFLALGRALNAGADYADAVEAGKLRAEGLGESGVQWASRAANQAAAGDDRIVGWTRTLGAGSCSWCIQVSAQRYHSAESASFGHLRCNCGVDPIIGSRDPGRVVNNA